MVATLKLNFIYLTTLIFADTAMNAALENWLFLGMVMRGGLKKVVRCQLIVV